MMSNGAKPGESTGTVLTQHTDIIIIIVIIVCSSMTLSLF
jgi:hypothetical protein